MEIVDARSVRVVVLLMAEPKVCCCRLVVHAAPASHALEPLSCHCIRRWYHLSTCTLSRLYHFVLCKLDCQECGGFSVCK
jgi:hypothetical protein